MSEIDVGRHAREGDWASVGPAIQLALLPLFAPLEGTPFRVPL